MDIKVKLTEEINNGKRVIEFESGTQSINLLVKNINRALKDLGQADQYILSIMNSMVRLELK